MQYWYPDYMGSHAFQKVFQKEALEIDEAFLRKDHEWLAQRVRAVADDFNDALVNIRHQDASDAYNCLGYIKRRHSELDEGGSYADAMLTSRIGAKLRLPAGEAPKSWLDIACFDARDVSADVEAPCGVFYGPGFSGVKLTLHPIHRPVQSFYGGQPSISTDIHFYSGVPVGVAVKEAVVRTIQQNPWKEMRIQKDVHAQRSYERRLKEAEELFSWVSAGRRELPKYATSESGQVGLMV